MIFISGLGKIVNLPDTQLDRICARPIFYLCMIQPVYACIFTKLLIHRYNLQAVTFPICRPFTAYLFYVRKIPFLKIKGRGLPVRSRILAVRVLPIWYDIFCTIEQNIIWYADKRNITIKFVVTYRNTSSRLFRV